jgi:hypothetical protein
LKKEYGSLLGRLKQADSVLRQVDGGGALVELKTGYEKVPLFDPARFAG